MILRTPRLILRPLKDSDAQGIVANVKDHTLKCMACLVLEHAQDLFLLSHELK